MPEKPKVIHLINSLDNGGCENMLLRLLPLMTRTDNMVVTLMKEGELAPLFKAKKIKLRNLGLTSVVSLISYRRLRPVLDYEKPAIIVTYLIYADAVGRLIIRPRSKVKVIPYLRTTYNHERYRVHRLFEGLTHSLVAEYLANSASVKQFYAAHFHVPKERITVIPNGIDVSEFDKTPIDDKLIAELGLHRGDLAITCVANLHPNKGHSYLLKAFEALFKQHENLQLYLVGDGVAKDALNEQIQAYQSRNHVHFLGRRRDVPAILKLTDIFVLPTLFEGMSNAILEAMASHCAIITTDIPENRVMLKSALFVAPRSSNVIQTALEELIEQPSKRKDLGQAAYNEVKQNYDIHHVAQEFEDFILKRV